MVIGQNITRFSNSETQDWDKLFPIDVKQILEMILYS